MGGTEPAPTRADVAVVGAGIAGLQAAVRLHEAGRTVVVLEASERTGGRLRSVRCEGGDLDLGASWFWPNESRIQDLVRELGIATHPQYRAGAALYQDPSGVQRLPYNPVDVESGRFSDGADSLTDALTLRLPEGVVRTRTPVVRIAVPGDRGGVRVVTAAHESGAAGRVFTASHVILAIPPAVATRIDFSPALPDSLRSLIERTPVWMGATTKVVVRYAAPFWRAAGLAGAAISHLGPLREVHDMSGPGGRPAALFGFASPMPGASVSESEVRHQLGALFGEEAAEPEELLIQDWRNEPWISPPGVESLQDFGVYGHPLFLEPTLGGRVHWASTETSTIAPGHIEGALQASERAVRVVLEAHGGNPTAGLGH